MKTLFHVLGKRSEHNRPDRDDHLDMDLDNLDPSNFSNRPFRFFHAVFRMSIQNVSLQRSHRLRHSKNTWTVQCTIKVFLMITTVLLIIYLPPMPSQEPPFLPCETPAKLLETNPGSATGTAMPWPCSTSVKTSSRTTDAETLTVNTYFHHVNR